MLDSMLAMSDLVTNFWSLGLREGKAELIMTSFRCADGWFAVQVGREHQFAKLAELVGAPDWLTDDRLATRAGWVKYLDELIRPRVERWAADRTRTQVCSLLGEAGIAAGPVYSAPEVIADEHVARRHMLVEMPRPDGIDEPVLIPGNPVKLSNVSEGPETRVPWVGEHTTDVLRSELDLDDSTLADLRADGVIN